MTAKEIETLVYFNNITLYNHKRPEKPIATATHVYPFEIGNIMERTFFENGSASVVDVIFPI